MKKAFRHIAVFFLAGIVLLSSTGLSINRLYCACKDESKVSLFAAEDDCAAERQGDKSCCAPKKCCSTQSGSGRDCNSKQSQYVHLDTDYLLFSVDFKLHAPDALPPAAWQSRFPNPFAGRFSSVEPFVSPLPPGKERLAFLQTFLC